MKKFIILFISILILNGLSSNAAEIKTLFAGTEIPIIFVNEVSTKTAKPNQAVNIKIAQNVQNGNVIFFRAGDEGVLYIKDVVRARKFSKAGRMKFGGLRYNNKDMFETINYSSDGYIVDTNGLTHAIGYNKEIRGKRIKILNIISSCMIWNPIGWATFWIKGKEAVIKQNTQDNVLLLDNFSVEI